jgi:H+/gluconate symporter-like permease
MYKWRNLNNKRHEKYSYFIVETIQIKIEVVNIFLLNMRILTECLYTAFHNNFNGYKNSTSQSIKSIAKIIINANCMKETFPETFKE